jgi:Arc/MetJ family transcription regulator
MRTNIEIDDTLMQQAMEATGAATKRAAVEAALRTIVRIKKQEGIRRLFGKVVWRGHDDDWFASDAEILKKRQRENQAAAPDGQTAEQALPQDELVGGRGRR